MLNQTLTRMFKACHLNHVLFFSLMLVCLLSLKTEIVSGRQTEETQPEQSSKQDEGNQPEARPANSQEGTTGQQGQTQTGQRRRGGRGRVGQGGPGSGRFAGGQGGPSQAGSGQSGASQGRSGNRPGPTATSNAPAVRQMFPDAWMSRVKFDSIGPANMSGRIPAIAVYEKDPTIWWAASASGGLLKTTNDGFTFEHQFDDQSVVSIGDVQVFANDSNIVWVGTGEANPRNSVSWGNGVYKSLDGGKTWKHLGLDKTFQTGRIALHPTDSNIAYVGALGRLWGDNEDRGVYKTSDGGVTWEKVLYIDAKTGIIDLQMHPTNPDILVAAAYERQRDGFDGNDPGKKFGPGSGIYQTTDAGKTWEKMSAGLPSCNKGRIGLNWSRTNPDHVYAIVESEKIGGGPEKLPYLGIRSEDADAGVRVSSVEDNSPAKGILQADDIILQIDGQLTLDNQDMNNAVGLRKVDQEIELLIVRDGKKETLKVKIGERPQPRQQRPGAEPFRPFGATLGGQQENKQGQQGENESEYGGLFKSIDAGKTWTRINSINPRPMYYSQVRIDPTDENNIYILGTSLYKSKDGGITFTDDGHGDEVHVDHHSLWIDPRDSRHIILGNDGGIYVTRDRMKTWDHLNHVAIGQFYHVGLDATEDYKVYGGLQDNGSWGGPRRSSYGGVINSDWIRIGGGDGFVCLVDPEDPDQLYSESQNGAMGRFNLKTGERGSIRPRGQRGTQYRFNWKTPFILSPHNSKMHYSAGNYVFRSFYKGDNVAAISPEITNTDQGSGSAISESAVEAGVLYVGTTDGAVWMTKDGGQNWEAIFSKPEVKEQPAATGETAAKETTEAAQNPTKPETGDKPVEKPTEPPMETAPVQDMDSVAGSWSGTFESSDSAITGEFDMELTLEEDGVVTGTITADEETTSINSGIYDREKNTLTFAVETPLGELRPTFTLKDQKLTAEVPLPDGLVLKIEAVRRINKQAKRIFTTTQEPEETKPEEAKTPQEKTVDGQATEAKASEEKSAEGPTATAEEPKKENAPSANAAAQEETKPSPVAKVIAGNWSGEMLREGQAMGQFTLNLKVDEAGKISGTYQTDRGDGEVLDGKYDVATQQLTLPIETGRMAVVLSGKVEGNKLTGEMDFGGGRFTANIQAEKTGATTTASASTAAVETKALGEWLPGPRWVSSIEASKHQRGRCYISLDGHRSNDDGIYLFASEDYGKTWRSLRGNLPDSAGSIRVLREDISNPDVLYLGCEFSAWLSVDRGKSWTKFTGLPTVAVHELAQHPTNGEIVVGTHGRSLWVFDASTIRQINEQSLSEAAHLYQPNKVIRWRQMPERGSNSTRAFATKPSDSGASIYYSLSRPARSVVISIEDIEGREIFRTEGETGAGLQKVEWDLRRGGGNQGARRFRGAAVAAGQYRVELQVNDDLFHQTLTVSNDPNFPEPETNGVEDLWEEVEMLLEEEKD